MTLKTTKTILFTSLITAMILPFSGMITVKAAPNENANDKVKRTYQVNVLSTEIIDEYYVDGIKITKFKQIVKQTDMPTMKDFISDNQEYFDFLIDELGSDGK